MAKPSPEEIRKMIAKSMPTLDDIEKRRYTWREDRNCLSWWFPRIQAVGLPVPETEILWTDVQFAHLFDNKAPEGYDNFIEALDGMIQRLGGYPIFLRTGQTSAKHSWESSCYVPSRDVLPNHVFQIVEFSELADMMGLPCHVWAARKLLPVKPLFHCQRYGNMPVVPELRVFVDGWDPVYSVPYWPDGAIEEGEPNVENWQKLLHDAAISGLEVERAKCLASSAGKACQGRWSVDILKTDKGLYVTDMAVAERSYGYDENKF